jgi:ElaB/YqjD/DUF883 family membrane-anchored ribosome-binding protein
MANRLLEYERPELPEGAWWPAGQGDSQDLQQRLGSMWKQATQWVREHPEVALTTAVVAGVVLGWLIKRR